MSPRLTVLVLLAALTAAAAQAQTYVPGQTQQMLNQEQLNIQSQQLQQLQRQNVQGLGSPDPSARMQAAQTQLQLNQQAAQTQALRQQMLTPGANPASLSAQLQASGAQIQQIQPPAPIP